MACDTQTLLAIANCFNCVPPGQWQLLRIALLCRISQGVTLACDPQTLLSEAAAFNIPGGQMQLLELALLCRIQTAGVGTSGAVSQQVLATGNSVPPPDPTKPALSYNVATQVLFEWNVATQLWM
jgi:hypothetical protein